MSVADDIRTKSKATFKADWTVRKGAVVPAPEDLTLSNDAVHLETAAVLYADLDQSTALVKDKKWWFAAEVYKSFLYATARLINSEGGTIVSYDGDRIMGVFIGRAPCNDAARCALKINYAVKKIVQVELDRHYGDRAGGYQINHVVGIDVSDIRAARTGVRGDNDIVWVGNAANLAAKLTSLSADWPTRITKAVYNKLNDAQKFSDGRSIWTERTWNAHGGDTIYASKWTWTVK
ncbi:MAG TPA: adenylate/guanylate cyclase domain-containing protein [Devosia sp.]|uniref:adenylate/guanylate cyclase domain-containing protein n=1 Tax=Devosia sp. TaxID=1871048 RepID=UPI002DDCD353|nr:adenylate/guanylate cyclase domain-containing protein [Devosia sp.]HEV2517197.1 adenylate/guanylate cyclase domain-containing protein [Devosia sp.]